MPEIGEIRRIKDIHPDRHYVYASGLNKFIWAACDGCGKARWIPFRKTRPTNPLCQKCGCGSNKPSGSANNFWKGGRSITQEGYIRIRIYSDDFFWPMAQKRARESTSGSVAEHRLVMAKHLGRCLHKWELVHHKGIHYPTGSIENKQDNSIENLMIIVTGHEGNGMHSAKLHCPYCDREFRVR